MAISPEEVEKIAKLSHLKLSEQEKEMMKEKISSILSYVDRLAEADTNGIEATAHISGVENVLRDDEVRDCDPETRASIINSFPERDGDQLKVRPVFE